MGPANVIRSPAYIPTAYKLQMVPIRKVSPSISRELLKYVSPHRLATFLIHRALMFSCSVDSYLLGIDPTRRFPIFAVRVSQIVFSLMQKVLRLPKVIPKVEVPRSTARASAAFHQFL